MEKRLLERGSEQVGSRDGLEPGVPGRILFSSPPLRASVQGCHWGMPWEHVACFTDALLLLPCSLPLSSAASLRQRLRALCAGDA